MTQLATPEVTWIGITEIARKFQMSRTHTTALLVKHEVPRVQPGTAYRYDQAKVEELYARLFTPTVQRG